MMWCEERRQSASAREETIEETLAHRDLLETHSRVSMKKLPHDTVIRIQSEQVVVDVVSAVKELVECVTLFWLCSECSDADAGMPSMLGTTVLLPRFLIICC